MISSARAFVVVLILLVQPGICYSQPQPLPSLSAQELAVARNAGVSVAADAIKELDELTDGVKFSGKSGTIVAEGDSWFDYPLWDILKILRWRHGYRIESAAHYGDRLEGMAYDTDQLNGLAEKLLQLRDEGIVPRAILLSGGGNDIAGPELEILINHRRSGLPPLNNAVLTELVSHRLRLQMISLVAGVDHITNRYFSRRIPIIIHGYDYPIPDGRGFVVGRLAKYSDTLPGPWLRPSFESKGYDLSGAGLKQATGAMKEIIDKFNSALMAIPQEPGMGHVKYVHVLETLDSPDYKDDWGNELHPTKSGFGRVAQKFAEALDQTPRP